KLADINQELAELGLTEADRAQVREYNWAVEQAEQAYQAAMAPVGLTRPSRGSAVAVSTWQEAHQRANSNRNAKRRQARETHRRGYELLSRYQSWEQLRNQGTALQEELAALPGPSNAAAGAAPSHIHNAEAEAPEEIDNGENGAEQRPGGSRGRRATAARVRADRGRGGTRAVREAFQATPGRQISHRHATTASPNAPDPETLGVTGHLDALAEDFLATQATPLQHTGPPAMPGTGSPAIARAAPARDVGVAPSAVSVPPTAVVRALDRLENAGLSDAARKVRRLASLELARREIREPVSADEAAEVWRTVLERQLAALQDEEDSEQHQPQRQQRQQQQLPQDRRPAVATLQNDQRHPAIGNARWSAGLNLQGLPGSSRLQAFGAASAGLGGLGGLGLTLGGSGGDLNSNSSVLGLGHLPLGSAPPSALGPLAATVQREGAWADVFDRIPGLSSLVSLADVSFASRDQATFTHKADSHLRSLQHLASQLEAAKHCASSSEELSLLLAKAAQVWEEAFRTQEVLRQVQNAARVLPFKDVMDVFSKGSPLTQQFLAALSQFTDSQRQHLFGKFASAAAPAAAYPPPPPLPLPPAPAQPRAPRDNGCFYCKRPGHSYRGCRELRSLEPGAQTAAFAECAKQEQAARRPA
ncbi:hypothetical protein Agub_g16117, partial [Astrephomene gubernaculifera]